jgi:hypothetical protein
MNQRLYKAFFKSSGLFPLTTSCAPAQTRYITIAHMAIFSNTFFKIPVFPFTHGVKSALRFASNVRSPFIAQLSGFRAATPSFPASVIFSTKFA